MIRLTEWNGDPIYVAPEQIRIIERHPEKPERTRVYFMDEGCRTVLESPEEVARKVREYRIAIQGYMVAYQLGLKREVEISVANPGADMAYWKRELDRLAGFEEKE